MKRLRREVWWQMPAGKTPVHAPKHPSPFRWAAPYWVVGLTAAALLQLEVIPVKSWLGTADAAPQDEEPAAPTPPPAPLPTPTATAEPIARQATTIVESDAATTFHSIGGPRKRAPERRLVSSPVDEPRAEPRTVAARPKPAAKKRTPRREPEVASKPSPTPKPAKPSPAPADKPSVSATGGQSCEAAVASYSENVRMGDNTTPADLTAARYGAVLNSGSYFSHCGVPSTMRIHICAAVQNGVALGVTVTTTPGNKAVASCIAGAVRGLAFPSHPRMDVTRTTFD